jgi:hypothetical protein
LAEAFIEAIAKHRHWEREAIGPFAPAANGSAITSSQAKLRRARTRDHSARS